MKLVVITGCLGLIGSYVTHRCLEKGWKVPRKPKDHHLRRAYALGDLYEKSGSLPRARELFIWIRRHSPKFADVGERVRDLS